MKEFYKKKKKKPVTLSVILYYLYITLYVISLVCGRMRIFNRSKISCYFDRLNKVQKTFFKTGKFRCGFKCSDFKSPLPKAEQNLT